VLDGLLYNGMISVYCVMQHPR